MDRPVGARRDQSSPAVSRRTLLRGVGVSMALPWLESLPMRAAEQAGRPPMRFAAVFSGNGFHSKEWWARGSGAAMELGKVLEPLTPFREKLNFIDGLWHASSWQKEIHSGQTGPMLSGANCTSGGIVRAGTSVDQAIAQRIGDRTKVPSLVLGCELPLVGLHKNYSLIYSSHISWSSATTPTPLELYPALVFDRMFRDAQSRADRSVLDAILEDARSLRGRISTSDGRRLDEYLTAVRDVEQRLETAGKRGRSGGWRPTSQAPDTPRPAEGYPDAVPEHMALMCDMLVLALRTDSTRVATLKLNNDHSGTRFGFLGKECSSDGHSISHDDNEATLKVNRFFLEQTASIAAKLDAVEEGDRTLLDNTMLIHCSSMITGDHTITKLPVVMVGGAGGGVQGGRVLDYMPKDWVEPKNRQLCRLYLSIMHKMGVEADTFGDATEPLNEI